MCVCVFVRVCVCVFRGMQDRKRFDGVCVRHSLFACTEVKVCVCLCVWGFLAHLDSLCSVCVCVCVCVSAPGCLLLQGWKTRADTWNVNTFLSLSHTHTHTHTHTHWWTCLSFSTSMRSSDIQWGSRCSVSWSGVPPGGSWAPPAGVFCPRPTTWALPKDTGGDYLSHLTQEHLRIPPEELQTAAQQRDCRARRDVVSLPDKREKKIKMDASHFLRNCISSLWLTQICWLPIIQLHQWHWLDLLVKLECIHETSKLLKYCHHIIKYWPAQYIVTYSTLKVITLHAQQFYFRILHYNYVLLHYTPLLLHYEQLFYSFNAQEEEMWT